MGQPMRMDERLKEWATETQKRYLDAVAEHGSMRAAAKALGLTESTIRMSMGALRLRAALKGYSPEHDMTHAAPDTHMVKGVSSYYGSDGRLIGQWVKTKLDDAVAIQAMKDAARAFVADLPALPAPPAPLEFSTDVIPWIQIGDAHIGMLAHEWEVGETFNLEIAEAELLGAIDVLVSEMPPVERCVINDLGDATHYDNATGTTAHSGHVLDKDGRFPAMLRVYSRVMRSIVDKALTKARHVDVIVNQGNHSRINDFWMREMLEVVYGHTGRVHVLNNDTPFIAYRMGNTLVMTHHSDKVKPRDLIGVMTTDFRSDFGATHYHYIDIGHIHHRKVAAEHPSIVVESWNNLAPGDQWSHDSGYRAKRSISVVLRSRTYGEVGRRVLPVQEVRDRIGRATQQARSKVAFTV